LPVDAEAIQLTLKRDGKTFELTKNDKTAAWSLKQAGQKPAAADAHDVDDIVRELRNLRAEKLVNEKPSKKDLAQYGLGKKFEATLVMRKADKKTETRVYEFGNETKDGVYAKESGDDMVFTAGPFVLQTLKNELRDRTLFHFTAAKVKEIRLQGWKPIYKHLETLDLKRDGTNGWKVVKAPGHGFQLESAKFDAFLNDLTDTQNSPIERFVDGAPKPEYQFGSGQQTLIATLTVDGVKAPVVLTIGKLDAKSGAYFAQSSTLPGAVFLIPRDRLDNVMASADHFSKAKAPTHP
jgi:hypothetical protein